jgi:RNA polymerase sigma factor (TIGR02999 family)
MFPESSVWREVAIPMPLSRKPQYYTEEPDEQISLLLGEIAAGNEAAKGKLIELVYDRLHKMASTLMPWERSNHTLQPTALVHEAYFKLFVGKPFRATNRAYFFGAAANAMRQVLIDYSRRVAARPEGKRVPLLDGILEIVKNTYGLEFLDLNNALEELRQMHGRHWEVVTLRFFGGLQWSEIATCLNVSTSTVEKDWQAARAWLYRSLKGKGNDAGTMGRNK